MKKFLLVYRTPTTSPRPSEEQMKAMLAQWQQWKTAFPTQVSDLGDGLLPSGRTITGQVVSDGPSIESKELVSGYSLVQVSGADEAVAVARACPILSVPGASIEVRPLAGFSNASGQRKFLLMYRTPPAAEARQPSAEELQTMLAQWQQWKTAFPAQVSDMGDGLLPTGRTIKGTVVTDGPSVESKEVVSGYSIVQAKSDDEALSVAKACPILRAPGTSIEVRQLAGY